MGKAVAMLGYIGRSTANWAANGKGQSVLSYPVTAALIGGCSGITYSVKAGRDKITKGIIMERITNKQLEAVATRINRILSTPETCYTKQADGHYKPNANCYFISYAYGGAQLQKMSSRDGCTGIDFTLPSGHVPKRELMQAMQAFIAGLEATK